MFKKWRVCIITNLISERDKMLQKVKYVVLVLFCLVVVSSIYYFGSGRFYEQRQKDIVFKEMLSSCDLHTDSCSVDFDSNKSITLNIENKPLFSQKELLYLVKTEGFSDDKLLLSVVGVKMNMGLFEKKFVKNLDGVYEAKLFLPSCVSGLMKWKISIISPKEGIGANFIIDLENQ